MITVKKHQTPEGRTILAAADTELLGKKYEEGEMQLDLTSQFYQGKDVSTEEFVNMLKNANILNLVGRITIHAAAEAGVIEKDGTLCIDGIEHVQAVFE